VNFNQHEGTVNNQKSTASILKLSISAAVFVGVCGFLFWELYKSSVGYLLGNWNEGDYSYAYLIPFVITYLIWEKRELLRSAPVEGVWWGIAPLAIGIALYWLGELAGEYYTLYVSAWLMLIGILWLHLGRLKIRILAFSFFLLLTAIPLPAFLYFRLSFELQLISSQIGTALLRMMDIAAHREGNIIDIGLTQLQVVKACSGLRYFFSLLVLGLIVSYFSRASVWKRALVVLSTIPLTIFWNCIRIAMTGYLWVKWGPRAAEGLAHDFMGFVIFLVSMAVLIAEMWVLGKIGKKGPRSVGRKKRDTADSTDIFEKKEEISDENALAGAAAPVYRKAESSGSVEYKDFSLASHLPRALISLALLAATLAGYQAIDFRHKIPIREPLSKFPLDLAEWRGSRERMDPDDLRTLALTDYALIDYKNDRGQNINLYVAYFETQVKGGSIHSPETCLPGAGWELREEGALSIPVKYGGAYLNVNRIVAEQMGRRALVYFWFPQRGRILTNIFQLKVYNFWDALTLQRTDGALVRVFTPMSGPESVEDAAVRLNEFLTKVVPVLDPFIPGRELYSTSYGSQTAK